MTFRKVAAHWISLFFADIQLLSAWSAWPAAVSAIERAVLPFLTANAVGGGYIALQELFSFKRPGLADENPRLLHCIHQVFPPTALEAPASPTPVHLGKCKRCHTTHDTFYSPRFPHEMEHFWGSCKGSWYSRLCCIWPIHLATASCCYEPR